MKKIYLVLVILAGSLLFSMGSVVGAEREGAVPVTEGTYRGEVWTGTGPNGSNIDLYRITLFQNEKLTIKATKLSGDGIIEIQSFDSTPYPVIPGIYIRLLHTGDTLSQSFVNDNLNQMVIYLEVWGDGNYELEVMKEEVDPFEPLWIVAVILILIVVLTLVSVMAPFAMMFIAVLVIIIILGRSKKKKTRKKTALRKGSKGKRIKRKEGPPRQA